MQTLFGKPSSLKWDMYDMAFGFPTSQDLITELEYIKFENRVLMNGGTPVLHPLAVAVGNSTVYSRKY